MKPVLRQALLLFSWLPLQLLWASENPTLILPDERSWLKPDEAIELRLPPRLIAVAERLQLELDAIDVTQQLSIEDGKLSFVPPESMSGGEHELILLELQENSELIEHGRWVFEVRRSRRFQEAEFSPQAGLAWRRLADQAHLGPVPEREGIQANAGFDGTWGNPGYRFKARTSLVHDSSLDEDSTQLYDFLFTLEKGNSRLQFGQQTLEGGSLVLADFDRRGLSARQQTEGTGISAFVLRTDSVTALSDALVPRNRDQATAGIMASISPLREMSNRLRLRVIWIDSRGTEYGAAELGEQTLGEESLDDPAQGNAWSLAIESRLLQQRLLVAAEIARSRFDFDGSGGALDANTDEAYRLDLQFTPTSVEDLEWTAGLRLQQTGIFFHSLANAALANDKRQLTARLALARGDLAGDLQLGLERDNIDDRTEFPTIQSRLARFNLVYSPLSVEDWKVSLFANPDLQLSYMRTSNRQIDHPPLYAGDETNNVSQDLNLSANFSPEMWSWGVSYQLNRFEDETGLSESANSHLLGVEASIPLGEALRISPRIQTGRSSDPITAVKQRDLLVGMGLVLDRQPVAISLDYSLNRSRSSDSGKEYREQILEMSVDWTLLAMRSGQPGVNLYLRANWLDGRMDADTRQIVVGLRAVYGPE